MTQLYLMMTRKAEKGMTKQMSTRMQYKEYISRDGTIRKAYMKSGRSDNVLKIPFVQGTSKERTG